MLCSFGENGLGMASITFGDPGIPDSKMRLMAANKDGCYHEFYAFMTLLSLKLLIYGEIPLHINNMNGLKLYLRLDIGGYMILCGEML